MFGIVRFQVDVKSKNGGNQMRCSICGKQIQFPEKFHSTGPLISRGFSCDECYLTWILPYREKELKKVPDSIVWTSRGEEYLRED